MTQLEERLTAALDARAHQIDETDLSPAELPEAGRRHRVALVLAAAACTALVIGVPYGIAQLDSSKNPTPPSNTPSETPSVPGVGEGAGWPVAQVGRIDLDGDGAEETMRLRVEPASDLNPSGARSARVEVALPDGTLFTVLPESSAEFTLEGAVPIEGSAGEELLVSIGTSLRVLDLVDGELVALKAPADPPLMRRTDSSGRVVTWLAVSNGLYSLRSIEPIGEGVERYRMQRWLWRITDGELSPGIPDERCVNAEAPDQVVSCVPTTPSSFIPSELIAASGEESLWLSFAVNGQAAKAHLDFRDGYAGDYVSEGDAKLVVTIGDRTWEAGLPNGPAPELVAPGIVTTSAGGFGVLVRMRGMNDEGFDVFGWVDDELVVLDVPQSGPFPEFGTEIRGGGFRWTRTWVQADWLYSAVETTAGGQYSVYRWEQVGSELRPIQVPGTYCFPAEVFDPDTGYNAGNGRAC